MHLASKLGFSLPAGNMENDSAAQAPMVDQLGTEFDDATYTCPRCNAQLLVRRRAAHDATWCPALHEDDNSCTSSASNGSEGKLAPEEEQQKAYESGGLRRRSGKADAEFPASINNFQVRCPHGFHPEGCLQCSSLHATSESMYLPEDENLAETPKDANRRAWLSFCFLIMMVGPACGAGMMLLQEFFAPAILRVAPDDVSAVQNVFFGGDPWLVFCVNKRTASNSDHVPALTKASERLRPHRVRIAEIHCWTPLPTKKGPRTLARRFKFRDKPPVALFVSKRHKPKHLNVQELDADKLVQQVLREVNPANEFSGQTFGGTHGRKGSGTRKTRPKQRDRVGRRPEDEVHVATEDEGANEPEAEVRLSNDEDEDIVNLDD